MKKIILLVIAFVVSKAITAQSYFQNIYADSIYGESNMAVSPDAYYLLQSGATPNFVPKLIKSDINGNLIWAKRLLYGSIPIGVSNIQYHNNTLLVTGVYQSAGYFNFVAKLDTAGNIIWTQQINYGDININTEIIPLASGFLLCGHRDILQGSIYTFDITLARFDDNGNLIWATAHGSTNFDFVCSAAVIASNGDIMVAGNYGLRTPPDYNPMLARFDSSGNLLWLKYFSDPSGFFTDFIPTDMCATSDGNFALTGFSVNTNSNYDPHVIKIDPLGNILWAKRLYQIGWQEYGNSIICDYQNYITLAGPYYYLTDYGDFAAQFDLAGNYIGSSIVAKTSRNQPALFSNIYDSHGNDLFERAGNGYAYSTSYYYDYYHHSQCLVTTDYTGILNCTSLGGTYPFTVSDITWTFVTGIASSSQTGITATPVALTTAPLTESQLDICNLVGINNTESDFEISVYPNPTAATLTISNLPLSSKNEIKVFDIAGKEIYCKKAAGIAFEMDLKNFVNGMYMIHIISGNKKMQTKFIKAQ